MRFFVETHLNINVLWVIYFRPSCSRRHILTSLFAFRQLEYILRNTESQLEKSNFLFFVKMHNLVSKRCLTKKPYLSIIDFRWGFPVIWVDAIRSFARCTDCIYFFFANKSRIPFLIASPFVMPFLRQYSCNLLSVSASNLTLKRTSFGFSTFGLPVLGDTCSPHFLSRIKCNICATKSQSKTSGFHIFSEMHNFTCLFLCKAQLSNNSKTW